MNRRFVARRNELLPDAAVVRALAPRSETPCALVRENRSSQRLAETT